jgi:voltage-gated potassium channel
MTFVSTPPGKPLQSWRLRLYTIIFESDTRAGRWFDQCLILFILLSIAVVVADSVPYLHERLSEFFSVAEWLFTLLFTLEYLARQPRGFFAPVEVVNYYSQLFRHHFFAIAA